METFKLRIDDVHSIITGSIFKETHGERTLYRKRLIIKSSAGPELEIFLYSDEEYRLKQIMND